MPGESERIGASSFFKALYHGVGAGYIEIRPTPDSGGEPPHPKFFSWPKELDAAVAHCESVSGKLHVYFGVGLRRMARKPKGNPDFKLGGKENVGCVTAAFADFDFKDVPEVELRPMLAAFPHRPSIVVKSGHGIHVYWLLDYPAMGEHLDALQLVNLGLLTRFRAQRGPQDYSRILRVPGTLNIKAKYGGEKPVTEVTYFHPTRRCALSALTETLKDDIEKALKKTSTNSSLSRPAGGGAATESHQKPTSSASPVPPPAINERAGHPRPIPAITLATSVTDQMGDLFSEIWIEGQRHAMALRVAGLLAFSNVSQQSAEAVVARASMRVSGDTAKRLNDVTDTYQRFVSGGAVVGGPDMDRMIEEEFPAVAKPTAKKVLDQIRRLLPQPEKKSSKKLVEPDFEIVQLDKFDGRPPLYTVTLMKLATKTTLKLVRLEHKIFHYFNLFRPAVNEETDEFIANIEQWQWEKMRDEAKRDGRLKLEAPPQEATITGVLHGTLESFLDEKKENPSFGELGAFPGYNEEGLFFRLQSYKNKVKEAGLAASPQVVTEFLRRDGWIDGRRRIIHGGPAYRLWFKAVNGKASKADGNGNGHSKPQAEPERPLFGEVGP